MRKISFLILLLQFFTVQVFAADVIGMVLSKEKNVYALRDNKKIELHPSDHIYFSDKIITERDSSVQIMFIDETVVALDMETELNMEDFVFDNVKSNFLVEISKGAARVVTGKIVEQNRDGFKVNTPHSTIGIRGTTISVNVANKTVVTINEIGANHEVTVKNLVTKVDTIMFSPGQSVEVTKTGNSDITVVTGKPNINNSFAVENTDDKKEINLSTDMISDKAKESIIGTMDFRGEFAAPGSPSDLDYSLYSGFNLDPSSGKISNMNINGAGIDGALNFSGGKGVLKNGVADIKFENTIFTSLIKPATIVESYTTTLTENGQTFNAFLNINYKDLITLTTGSYTTSTIYEKVTNNEL